MKELTQLQDITSKLNFKNVFSSTMQLLHHCFTFSKLKYCCLYNSSPQLKNIYVTDLKVRVTSTEMLSLSLFTLLSSSLNTKPAIPNTTILATPPAVLPISDSLDSSLHNLQKTQALNKDVEGLPGCLAFSTACRKVHPNPHNQSRN